MYIFQKSKIILNDSDLSRNSRNQPSINNYDPCHLQQRTMNEIEKNDSQFRGAIDTIGILKKPLENIKVNKTPSLQIK